MNYKLNLSFLKYSFFLSVLIVSCKKSDQSATNLVKPADTTHTQPVTPKSTYKIQVLTGENQSDTVGHTLATPIQVQVFKDGVPFSNSVVEFQASGCNKDFVGDSNTVADGTNTYSWSLSEEVGKQSLKIVICDLKLNRLDSVTIYATGIKASGLGILTPGCSLGLLSTKGQVFYKLNSGRIFANYTDMPRYSDDNGLSWHPIKALKYFFLRKMSVSSNDDIVALVATGLIYSTDKGITWYQLIIDDPNNQAIYDAGYTQSGIMYYSSIMNSENYVSPGFHISKDNGKTWQLSSFATSPYDTYVGLSEQSNGDLYTVGSNAGLYKSTDGGVTFNSSGLSPVPYSYLFIDNNDYIYLAQSSTASGIYLSKDNSKTINKINFAPDVFTNSYIYPDMISKQKDGYYYIHTLISGTYRTKDFVNIQNINTRYNSNIVNSIVANNGTLLIATGLGYPSIRYIIQ